MAHEISFASVKDRESIMEFIHLYWKDNHILSRDVDMFNFQYMNKSREELLNFVIAKNKENKIDAILGFVPTENSNINSSVFGALWKVKPGVKSKLLGIKLLNFLLNSCYEDYLTLGLNETSSSIYKILGYTVGKMEHHVLVNDKISWYELCSINESRVVSIPTRGFELKEIKKSEIFSLFPFLENKNNPKKDIEYINSRYLEHPVYFYRFLAVYDANRVRTIIVVRKQHHNNSSCFRVVDVLGDVDTISSVAGNLQKFISSEGSEYLDIYSTGIEISIDSGFIPVDRDVVVPNYFSPFEKKNVDILYAHNISCEKGKVVIFKGDGDQDRPN